MIIKCERCNKKFNLDDKLVGINGRLLQCGNCQHKWFYKPSAIFEKKNILNDKPKISKSSESSESLVFNKSTRNKLKKVTFKETFNNNKKTKIYNNLVNFFLIFLITLVAIIITIDTFKLYISIPYPGIIPLLESLYETLYDLQLFIINLIN